MTSAAAVYSYTYVISFVYVPTSFVASRVKSQRRKRVTAADIDLYLDSP